MASILFLYKHKSNTGFLVIIGMFFTLTLCELLHLRNIKIFSSTAHVKGDCSATDGCKNKPCLLPAIFHPWAPLFRVAQTRRTGSGKQQLGHRGSPATPLGFLSTGSTVRPASPLEAGTNIQRKYSFFTVSDDSVYDTPLLVVPSVYMLTPGLPWFGEDLATAPPFFLWAQPSLGLFHGEVRKPHVGKTWRCPWRTSCRRQPWWTTVPSMLRGRPAGLQRPAFPAAVAPSRWRRPGLARAWTRTRTPTRTAAAGRQRDSGRPPGTALRRRRCRWSRAAVRIGDRLGSALPAGLGRPPPQLLLPRGSGGQAGALLCRGARVGAAGRGARLGPAGGRLLCGLLPGPEPLPGQVISATAWPVGSFPFPSELFPRRWAWIVFQAWFLML